MNLQTLARGAVAGTLATVPMTAVMGLGQLAGWMVTPPPKEVTAAAQQETGIRTEVGQPAFTVSWIGAHIAFGAASGALFTAGRSRFPSSPMLAGMVYGTTLWAVAYGAVLPALGLYPSLADDSHSRTGVMLVAHEVFGVALGTLSSRRS
ncbi:MAG TPA: DUF6789 family protein [Thermomicrobiales bacterium]|nr:DUF6789 family protein [Thermomicrobiales bacterium]